MGVKRKGNKHFVPDRIKNRNGVETTVYRLAPGGFTLPKPGKPTGPSAFGIPAPFASRTSRWTFRRALARARAAWYESMGLKPEPKNAEAPLERTTTERQLIRERLHARMVVDGFDPDTGYDALGFDMWGGHRDIKQTPGKPLTNLYTGKAWSPTGFLEDGTHAATGTLYDEDGVSRDGWTKGDICVLTGTVFNLGAPPRTRSGDTEDVHWAKFVEWRTPEVEAEMQESKRKHVEAVARIDEMVRIEHKMQRMGLAA